MVQLNRQYERNGSSGETINIKVIGVGGAGSNILDRVMLDGIEGAEMVAINTDVQSLTASVAAHKVQLGRNLTRGLGSGGDPEMGYAAAEEATDEIQSVLEGGTVIFVCTGLGGGTGSGAAPLVAKLAKDENALVLVFAALPFSFEGRRRCAQATESLSRLRAVADAVVCFENDRMAEITLPRMGIHEAFAAADLTISQSIRSVATLLRRPGLLHVGFDDVCAVVRHGDARALFGYGDAEGENRAHEALARALKNPLMNRGELLESTFHAIVHICGGANVTLGEVQIIMEELNRHINDQTQLFMAIGIDSHMGNRLSVSILSSLGQSGAAKPALTEKPEKPDYLPDLVARPGSKPKPINSPASAVEPGKGVLVQPPEPEMPPAEHSPEKALAVRDEGDKPASKSIRPVAKVEMAKNPAPTNKKPEAKQETLQFEPVSRGRFEKSEPTIIDGQDLDVPTFLRANVKLK